MPAGRVGRQLHKYMHRRLEGLSRSDSKRNVCAAAYFIGFNISSLARLHFPAYVEELAYTVRTGYGSFVYLKQFGFEYSVENEFS